jgi:endo-1,4-beta-xylanase
MSSRSLAQAFAGRMQIGCAVGGTLPGSLDAAETDLVARHFNVFTPENCMKAGLIQPERGRFDFGASDALVGFAEQRGARVVGHTLVWHSQAPAWLFKAGTSRALALGEMREHIHAVAGRYRGKLQGWDVVNEAITDDGEFLRETPALAAIGPDYLQKAFEFAHEADPGAELYYNDYNIEMPEKRERTLRLLRELQASGVRLDGVGIQGHWQLDQVPFNEIERAIDAYSALGLKVMITELDVDVVRRQASGADLAARPVEVDFDPYRDGCPVDVLERQAEQYAQLFEIFLAHPVSRVTFWGPHDGHSWLNYWPSRRTNYPLLFDRESQGKPALGRVLDVAARAG